MAFVLCDCILEERSPKNCPECRGRGIVDANQTDAALEAQFEKEFRYPDPKKHGAEDNLV